MELGQLLKEGYVMDTKKQIIIYIIASFIVMGIVSAIIMSLA